jgi:peptidyl-tRNA hydrolase
MKKKLSFFLIAVGLLFATQFNANAASQSYIIGDHTLMLVVPNDYMNAISVEIELILEDGSTFAYATTSAGTAVAFNLAGAPVKLVRTKYHLSLLESVIIDDDQVMS